MMYHRLNSYGKPTSEQTTAQKLRILKLLRKLKYDALRFRLWNEVVTLDAKGRNLLNKYFKVYLLDLKVYTSGLRKKVSSDAETRYRHRVYKCFNENNDLIKEMCLERIKSDDHDLDHTYSYGISVDLSAVRYTQGPLHYLEECRRVDELCEVQGRSDPAIRKILEYELPHRKGKARAVKGWSDPLSSKVKFLLHKEIHCVGGGEYGHHPDSSMDTNEMSVRWACRQMIYYLLDLLISKMQSAGYWLPIVRGKPVLSK
jgi:hypothetical protein